MFVVKKIKKARLLTFILLVIISFSISANAAKYFVVDTKGEIESEIPTAPIFKHTDILQINGNDLNLNFVYIPSGGLNISEQGINMQLVGDSEWEVNSLTYSFSGNGVINSSNTNWNVASDKKSATFNFDKVESFGRSELIVTARTTNEKEIKNTFYIDIKEKSFNLVCNEDEGGLYSSVYGGVCRNITESICDKMNGTWMDYKSEGAGNETCYETESSPASLDYVWVSESWNTCAGSYSTWSSWGTCSVSVCGGGTQDRTCNEDELANQTREVWCNKIINVVGGPSEEVEVVSSNCTDTKPATEQTCSISCNPTEPSSQTCNTDSCAYAWEIDPWETCSGDYSTWSIWTDWETCSVPVCGGGTQSRTRTCTDNEAASQTRGVRCKRTNDDVVVEDGLCSATVSKPITAQICSIGCNPVEAASETQTCNTEECSYSWNTTTWSTCVGDYSDWTAWTSWSTCSVAVCGGGTQSRTRTCTENEAASQSRTVTCVRDNDGTVVEDSLCSGTKPSVSQTCSLGCNPAESGTESQACNTEACAYEWNTGTWGTCSGDYSDWTSWTSWSTCSVPVCGGGTQSRTRTCTDSKNASQSRSVVCKRTNDGTTVSDALCTAAKPAVSQTCSIGCNPAESGTESQACNTEACTYSWTTSSWGTCGGDYSSWTAWTSWSTCDAACDGGEQTRTRTCTNDKAASQSRTLGCKRDNDGATVSTSLCPVATKPAVTQTCSIGCNPADPTSETQDCNTQACYTYAWVTGTYGTCTTTPASDWNSWGSWSACSVSCGGGWQTRYRTCKNNSIAYKSRSVYCQRTYTPTGAKTTVTDSYCTATKPGTTTSCGYAIPCVGSTSESQQCNTQPCCTSGPSEVWTTSSSYTDDCGYVYHSDGNCYTSYDHSQVDSRCISGSSWRASTGFDNVGNHCSTGDMCHSAYGNYKYCGQHDWWYWKWDTCVKRFIR